MSCAGFYRAKGNWCLECCPDCRTLLPPFLWSTAQCCKTINGLICYSYRECKRCVSAGDPNDPELNKVVSFCNDENYPSPGNNLHLKAGETSCCEGQCYDPRCYSPEFNDPTDPYRCTGLKPLYDGVTTGCCKGAGIVNYYTCQECVPDNSPGREGLFKIIEGCSDPEGSGYQSGKKQCCAGRVPSNVGGGCGGECYNDECDTCNSPPCSQPKLTIKCPIPGGDPTLTACCGGDCWDPNDECQECVQYVSGEELRPKDAAACPKCCGKKCCTTSSEECCDTANGLECYDPKCSKCE